MAVASLLCHCSRKVCLRKHLYTNLFQKIVGNRLNLSPTMNILPTKQVGTKGSDLFLPYKIDYLYLTCLFIFYIVLAKKIFVRKFFGQAFFQKSLKKTTLNYLLRNFGYVQCIVAADRQRDFGG